MKKPILTVAMSVFNGQEFLIEAVESILNQTLTDFEFIIVDDGSTDDTRAILEEYIGKDSRLKVLRQHNCGLTESLNRIINMAQGDYIARMDADDISLPERFEKQLQRLREQPKHMAVASWCQILDENDNINHEITPPDSHEFLVASFNKGINYYTHGSVMIKAKVFKEMGLVYRFKYGQDFDLWLRLSEKGRLGMVDEILYKRRDHPGTISRLAYLKRRDLISLMVKLAEERKLYGGEISDWRREEKEILASVSKTGKEDAEIYNRLLQARVLLLLGKNSKARKLLGSIREDVGSFKKCALPYYISLFPGFLTGPVLRLRDRVFSKRTFKRVPQDKLS